ncbi:hypothetical protein E4U24_005383 [Claviceps purpurea]|nr:hypothetical protein E4U24_005383 [Claviceps purpurea]
MSNPVKESLTGAYNNMVKSLAEFGMVTTASEEILLDHRLRWFTSSPRVRQSNWTWTKQVKQVKQAEPWERATRHRMNGKGNKGRQTHYVIQEALE